MFKTICWENILVRKKFVGVSIVYTKLELYQITKRFYSEFATVVVFYEGTPILPDTKFLSVLGLSYAVIINTIVPKLAVNFPNFHVKYPSVLFRFYLHFI